MSDLTGKEIAIVVGHIPQGGTSGERTYNLAVATNMKSILTNRGAKVYVHYHRTKAYGQRMTEMKNWINKKLPNCNAVIELHYNAFDDPSANGHEFFYRGSKYLAECVRNEFQDKFPWSKARREDGIERKLDGNGAGFLRAAPAWAVLVEPFFQSNPQEREFFAGRQFHVAEVYSNAIDNFLQHYA